MSHQKRIVVVGGVAAGASAAAKARRDDETAEILLLEKGPYVSFANCGLPYHLSKQIPNRDDLFVVTPERLETRYNITVKTNTEVTRIDRAEKRVAVTDLLSNTTTLEPYDTLILTPGADVVVPPIPGIEAEGVFPLKTIMDMDGVIAFIETHKPTTAAVIGGGFIGLEAAEALHALKLEVTVIEGTDQILPPWDPDIADRIEQHMLEDLWMEVVKADPVAEIGVDAGRVDGLTLKSGETVDAELVILAVGVRPNTRLAADAGLTLSEKGLIITNDRMQTSDPDIFAAGDAVQSMHRLTGEPCWLPMAGPANRQGRAAGANAVGGNITFPGVIGTAIVRVGEMAAGRTGLGEKEARAAGKDAFIVYSLENSHAGYYPGAEEVFLKLIVETPSGRLLGAQAAGRDGIDKRIDVLAAAVTTNMTVRDLVDLELTYAPPFGAAKDPINIAAMTAVDILDGRSEAITWDTLFRIERPPLILDVRSEEERKTVYIKETTPIDIDTLRSRLGELDKETPIRVYCRIGKRGYLAERLLKGQGFKDVKNIAGGWRSIWGDLRDEKLVGGEPRLPA